ncbi:hypothetical protein ACFLWX_04395 [Chloroflexota bacterium]
MIAIIRSRGMVGKKSDIRLIEPADNGWTMTRIDRSTLAKLRRQANARGLPTAAYLRSLVEDVEQNGDHTYKALCSMEHIMTELFTEVREFLDRVVGVEELLEMLDRVYCKDIWRYNGIEHNAKAQARLGKAFENKGFVKRRDAKGYFYERVTQEGGTCP